MTRACFALLAGLFALQLSSFSLAVTVIIVFSILLTLARCWALLAWFAAGVFLFATSAFLVIDGRVAHDFEGDSMLAVVRVVDFPKVGNGSTSLVLKPLDDSRIPERIRVSWFEPPVQPRFGDIWELELRLRRPRGQINPGVFDYETWLFRERTGATGYVVPGERNRLIRSSANGAIDRFRAELVDRVVALIPDAAVAAVLVAVTVGARHLLSVEQWQNYAVTGTSHLMAISGLHVGLAAFAAYLAASLLLALFRFRRRNHNSALLTGVVVAAAYVALSGFAVPAQRALAMLVLGAIAVLRAREIHATHVLGAACVLVVCIDPLATMAPGFKLSFSAVAILLWLGKRYEGRTRDGRFALLQRPQRLIRQLVNMQFALLLGLLPLTAAIFQRVAVLAPPINLVAVPLFSVVTVPATLLATALNWDKPMRVAASSIFWLERLISAAAGTPAADTQVAVVGLAACLVILLPLAWCALPSGWPGRHVAWLALASALLWKPEPPPHGCVEFTVLDVGQGLAVVLETAEHVVLYDTGPAYRGASSAAERVVLPFLQARHISRIDKVVLSHEDLDHAGGISQLHAATTVGEVWRSDPSRRGRQCQRGLGWSLDGIDFSFRHPSASGGGGGNNDSCVLLVEAGRYAVLLTGDIEAAAERELVLQGALQGVDAVTVPHHGSRTSSTTPFVERLSPQYAIVTAGYGNRWGFPKPDVVERWQRQGAEVLQTAESGALEFSVCQRDGVSSVRRYRDFGRRVWHEP